MASAEEGCPQGHEVADGVVAIANEFLEDRADDGDGFCVVETETPGKTALGEESEGGDG